MLVQIHCHLVEASQIEEMIKWKGSFLLPNDNDFYNKTTQGRKQMTERGSSPSCCSKLYVLFILETQNKIFFNETSLVLIGFDA